MEIKFITSSLALQSALYSSNVFTVKNSSARNEYQTARCKGVIPFCKKMETQNKHSYEL